MVKKCEKAKKGCDAVKHVQGRFDLFSFRYDYFFLRRNCVVFVFVFPKTLRKQRRN